MGGLLIVLFKFNLIMKIIVQKDFEIVGIENIKNFILKVNQLKFVKMYVNVILLKNYFFFKFYKYFLINNYNKVKYSKLSRNLKKLKYNSKRNIKNFSYFFKNKKNNFFNYIYKFSGNFFKVN